MYPKLSLLIDGEWLDSASRGYQDVVNPVDGSVLGQLPLAGVPELDRALAAAERAYRSWKKTTAHERYLALRKVSALVRERYKFMGELITLDQGKPLGEGIGEAKNAADHIDWYAEEGRRSYGRVIPSRSNSVRQLVLREPIGPVAAFTPWNFPISQAVRKIAGALAAGCSIILKAPEDTPSSVIELVRCFHDAGIPPGVVNLVFGIPSEVSQHLIASPIIRKVSFTGSVPVGRMLGVQAAQHMKRTTMELGGHAPLIVFDDANVDAAAAAASKLKFNNAGQVCVSPSRFFVQEGVYDRFAAAFVAHTRKVVVGGGTEKTSMMGPLANSRRLQAMQEFVLDARQKGARIEVGGERIGTSGFFFAPTVLTDVPDNARLISEEPFGPLAPLIRFKTFDEVVAKANSLEFGLAAYAFTRSSKTSMDIANALETGMVSINHFGLALPETPFGGIKESGHGSEGGSEGLEAYLNIKFVSEMGA
jgi:succinate-semialdehyde dehydrogenase/glutarate-semialdehyde dehydrogenase